MICSFVGTCTHLLGTPQSWKGPLWRKLPAASAHCGTLAPDTRLMQIQCSSLHACIITYALCLLLAVAYALIKAALCSEVRQSALTVCPRTMRPKISTTCARPLYRRLSGRKW